MKQLSKIFVALFAMSILATSCNCNKDSNKDMPKKMSSQQQSNNNMNKQTAKQNRSSDY